MAFPYNPDHRGYSDLESLLRGDFDAGALKLELGGELPPKPKVTWDVQTGHRSLKPAPEPQVRQVPEPVQPVPLRESPVDENTVGKPGYKFSLRGIDPFATRRLAPGEFYAPFRRPAEAPRAKGHASQLLANVNSMADEHKATIDHIMQQCDKVSRMMLLATANALRKSNAASERPMPKMTVRSHIKKELGRLAGLDEVHRLLDAQELDRPENDDILLYCSPEERQTKLQMEDFFLSSVKTFLKNERRHDFDLERVQKRLTLHSKDAEGVLNFAGHEDNGRGAARWIKNTEAVAMGALNKYETGQHKIFSDFAEKLKDTTDYMNKRMGSTGISMGSTGVSFAAPDTTVFLQPEERDMLQSLEMQKKQKEKTVWELKKQLDELIATRKNMDEVAPVSSGNTEAKMGTDQRSRHAESLDEMDEALTSLEEECLGAKKAAEAAGSQLARMVEFMATGQKNLRKLFGDLKITERKQEEARQRLQDLVLPESRQLVYEMAVELLDTTILPVQSSSSAVPASSESHKPDGTTSHLVAASKEASTQHLLAAARRRQQLRQAKEDIEAELERRRQAVTATQAARDAAQEPEKPLQNTGRNLQPSSLPASSTSGNVSELTQLAVQSTSEKLEEEQPTSPKKENQTRSKELGEFAEEAADAVDHDQDSKEEALTALERQVNMLEDSAHIRPASKNSHQGDERSDVSVPPGVPHEPSELEIEIVAHQDHGEHDKYEIHHPAALERHRPHELDSLEDVEDSETETDDVQQDDDADASPRTKMANAMANAMMKVRMTNYLRKAAQDVREEARKAALEISRQQPIETPKLSVTEYAVNLAKAAGLPREEAERLVDMMRLLSQQFLPFVYQTLLDMLSLPLGDQKMALKMLSLGHVDAASPMRSKGDGAKSLGIASLLATQILAMKEEAGLWDERKLQNAFLQTLEMDQDTERHGDLEVPEVPEDDDHGKFLLAYYKRARPSMRGQKRRVMEFQKGKPYMARSVVRMPHKIQSSSEIEREPERPALPAVAGQKMELPTIDLEESLDPEELNLLRRAQSWSMRRRRQDELDVARSEELRKYRRRASRDLDNYDLGFWEEMQEEIRQKKTALFEETQERRREEWSKLGIEDDQSGGEDTLTSQALKVHGKFTFGGGKQKVPGQKSPSGHPGESSKLSLLPPRKMAEIAVDEASVRLRMNLMLFPQIPGDSPESNLGLPSQQSLNGPSRPPPLAPAPKPNEDAAHAATQAAQAQAAQLAAQQAALWKPKGLPSGAAIFQPHGQLRFKDGRSHKPDGVTSHLAAASKVVFNQHLMAAARRRRLLRQDEGFEAELVRRAEELPTSPKKERLTRLKAFTARKRQVNRLAIAARMRAPSRNNQGEETSDVNVPPRAPHEPTLEQTLTHQDHGKLLLAYHRRAQPSMRGQKRRVLKPYMERSVARAPLKIQSSSEIEREPERPALPAVAVEKAELQTSDLEESLHPEELGLLRPAQSWSRRPRRQDDVARPDQLQYRTILDNSPTWKRISSSKDREEMQEEIRQKKTALFEEIRERRPEEWSKLGIEDDQSGGEDTLTSQILKMHGKFTFGGGKQKVSGQKSSKGHPGASPKLSLLPPRKMAEIPVDEACARLRMNLMLFHRSRGESPERNLGLPSLPSLPSLNGSPRPPRLVPAPKPNEDAAHAATQAAQAAQEAAVWKPKGLPVMPQFSSLKGGYAPKTEGFSRLPHTARPALERTEMDSNDVNQKAREMLHYLQRFDKAPLQRLLSSREGTRSKLETRRSMDAKQAKPTEHLPPIQKEGARSVSAQAAAWATFLEERLGRHLRTLSKSTPPPQRVTGREIRSLLLD